MELSASYQALIINTCSLAPKLLDHPGTKIIHSKIERSYAIIEEYSQEYFQPKIGRKIRIFILEKQCSYIKSVLQLEIKMCTGKLCPAQMFLCEIATVAISD